MSGPNADHIPLRPGRVLLDQFLRPRGLSQSKFARRIGISYPRLNQVIHGKRGLTADTAVRLARVLGTSPEYWLELEQRWRVWAVLHSPQAEKIEHLEPLDDIAA